MRLYQYVGPPALLAAAPSYPAGARIGNRHSFDRWISGRTAAELREPFTYVVDRGKSLLLAPRHSEHVACAGAERVRGAGELKLARHLEGWCVDAMLRRTFVTTMLDARQ